MTDLITLDFNIDEAAAGEPIPDGSYRFQLTKAEPGVSKAGNRKVHVESDIVDDPKFSGRRLFDDVSLTPAAAWKLVQFCKALGIDYKQPLEPAAWIGKTFYADVEADTTYDGTPRPKITRYRPSA